jgi:hypothetical protein
MGRVLAFRSEAAEPVVMNQEALSALGSRRLRAAADQAYAWAVYSTALEAAVLRGVTDPDRDVAVRSAGQYYVQVHLQFEIARTEHEDALNAAQPSTSSRPLS